MRKSKTIMALSMAAVVFAGSISAASPAWQALGAQNYSSDESALLVSSRTDASSTSEEAMTEVLLKVKEKLEVPSRLSEFDYSFYQGNEGSILWEFGWRTPDYSERYSVEADGEGHIIQVHISNNSSSGRNTPSYLADELQETAYEYILQLEPETEGHIQYKRAVYSTYGGYYTYTYERIENNIPMPDNYVTVRVDAENKSLKGFSAAWLYDAVIPSASGLIGQARASEIIGGKIDMELKYFRDYSASDTEDGSETVKTFLAYVPSDSYIAVNAKNGRVYTQKISWVTGSDFDEEASDSTTNESAGLTEQEIEAASELKELITSDEAVKLVKENKYLLIHDSASAVSSHLYKREGDGAESFVWNIEFTDPRPEDYENDDFFRPGMYAEVDAKTGEITSFYSTIKEEYVETGASQKYSDKKCRSRLESFINEQNEERLSLTVREKSGRAFIAGYDGDTPIYSGYDYIYTRVNEGVEYAGNNICGTVDSVTGKVAIYGFSWDDNIEFDSPADAISEAEALEAYLSYDGYGLEYEISVINNYDEESGIYTSDEQVRLVYVTNISPTYVDAFNGRQLTYRGERYKAPATYEYRDIEGIDAEREIKLLADMGIGFEGRSFHPDRIITKSEFGELLEKALYVSASSLKLTGKRTLTRQFAARAAAELLGYGELARNEEIFTTGFDDEAEIADGYKGYIAIAKALGLFEAEDGKINAAAGLTRAEAAILVLKLAKLA